MAAAAAVAEVGFANLLKGAWRLSHCERGYQWAMMGPYQRIIAAK